MCGRFVLNATPEAVQQEFNLSAVPMLADRFNIAPSQPVSVITNDAPNELSIVQWGLIPSWAKDPKMSYKMINARSETVHEKPSYRAPFKYRRCLIPTTGFYEWIKTEEGKQPYFIHRKDTDLFAFAGLWEVWRNPEGDEVWTCTILTTDANDKISHLHHRMPVILDGDARSAWLDKASDADELKSIMRPFDGEKMDYYPVSKAVNNVRNDNPMLLERDEPPQQQSMF
ncbi:MAG: SOS response-associated peptidase [Phototrophicaceae bacterium]